MAYDICGLAGRCYCNHYHHGIMKCFVTSEDCCIRDAAYVDGNDAHVVYSSTLSLQGGAWCKVSRDASDKMTAVVTLMLSYLHSTTADLGLPGDFKLQDFQLAAATLSADTVQAVGGRLIA